MQLPTIPKIGRLSKKHKITAAGAAAAAAVILTVTGLQATGGTAVAAGDPTGFSVSTGDKVKDLDAKTGMASQQAMADAAKKQADAQHKAAAGAAAKQADARKAAQATAKKQAAARAGHKAAADRSEHRVKAAVKHAVKAASKPAARPAAKPAPKPPVVHVAQPVAYSNNLDGWIRQSLAIMHAHHIPGSYNGIYRNVMRESSGNPMAINLWDINARNGIPSKGLLQVIDPTFRAYHVAGTSWNIYNPVANITAACNYAADKYGSMDNVNSAY